jgi:hypothetical protein
MTLLLGCDLRAISGADPLWRRRSSKCAAEDSLALAAKLGLPPRGFASPLGFWFAPSGDWGTPPPYRLELASPRPRGESLSGGPRVALIAEKRRAGSVSASARRHDRKAGSSERIALEVTGASARIEIDEAAWPEAREAAILAVATCWRLTALDDALDQLTDGARSMLKRGFGHAPTQLARELHRDAHGLILDLPDFEGPLTDPARFLASREAMRLYRRLGARLGLFGWRDRIDERAEVLEGLVEALAARRDHRQAIALQIALDVLIIVLLTTEVAVSLLAWASE